MVTSSMSASMMIRGGAHALLICAAFDMSLIPSCYHRPIFFAARRAKVTGGSAGNGAGASAMSRLKVVLAHDRTGLDELTMAKIRGEIQAVVAKYVIIDESDVQVRAIVDSCAEGDVVRRQGDPF